MSTQFSSFLLVLNSSTQFYHHHQYFVLKTNSLFPLEPIPAPNVRLRLNSKHQKKEEKGDDEFCLLHWDI